MTCLLAVMGDRASLGQGLEGLSNAREAYAGACCYRFFLFFLLFGKPRFIAR